MAERCQHKEIQDFSYFDGHGDARPRMYTGEQQVNCPVCGQWVWASLFNSPLALWNALAGKRHQRKEAKSDG